PQNSCATPRGRWRARASWQATAALSSSRGRSIWLQIYSRRLQAVAPPCCERTRGPAQLPDDDRARGVDRRSGDPRVLRGRLPVRQGVPVGLLASFSGVRPLHSALLMSSPAVFGINNSGVNIAVDLLILFLVVIWLALV